jgi:hypothetical protein
MIADRESSDLATRFIEETCTKQRIKPGQLTVHADRGSSMMSKPLALLMEDLGIRKATQDHWSQTTTRFPSRSSSLCSTGMTTRAVWINLPISLMELAAEQSKVH